MSRSLRYALMAGGLLLAVAALWLIVKGLMKPSEPAKKRVVQQIQLVKPPAPPPPPKEQPKPPEIKPREEVKVNEPPPPTPQQQQAQNEPPPSPNLGLDAQGSAGADGFGLAARQGGRDITTLGKEGAGGLGGGVSRIAFNAYTSLLQNRVQDEISRNANLRDGDYRAVVRVWLTREGGIQRVELVGTSGDPERDRQIRNALAEMAPLREPPPENMPQPVRLRITSRLTG
jgi:periplasmic protein TonB